MEQRKETAVEWLVIHLAKKHNEFQALTFYHDHHEEIKQAKQMEKEQIKDAFVECWKFNVPEGIDCKLSAEEYYNKTYANDTTTGLPEEDSKRRGWHY